MTHVVEAVNVSKVFRHTASGHPETALKNVSLTVEKGKITALIGPDSAGKTTFIRMICGLMFPSEGQLKVLGEDVTKKAVEIQDRLGYMPQKFGLYEDLTCMENMNLYADLHGIPKDKREERFKKLFVMTGLATFTERLAGKLSGGMKQKLGLACTLVRSPELLLLDEPTAGLDVMARESILNLFREYMEEDGERTILISSHISSDLEGLCDDLYMIHNGKIVLHEETDVLLGEYAVLKVDEEQYQTLDKQYILSRKKEAFGYQLLTNQKQFYLENYPKVVVENGTIDEAILMMIRGESV